MKLIRWSFHNIHIPMMEDEKGDLFCTGQVLQTALQIDDKALEKIYARHRDEFNALRATDCRAKEFLRANKVEFGIKRVREDMILWSEDDMLTVAFLSKSDTSREFRSHLRQFIKENARRGYVTEEQHNELLARVNSLEDLVLRAQPALAQSASAAGASLNAHKEVKKLRLVSEMN